MNVLKKLVDKRGCLLQLFSASAPLEYVAMEILGPLSKLLNGNLHLLVMTIRYSKLKRAIQTFETTVSEIAFLSVDK